MHTLLDSSLAKFARWVPQDHGALAGDIERMGIDWECLRDAGYIAHWKTTALFTLTRLGQRVAQQLAQQEQQQDAAH